MNTTLVDFAYETIPGQAINTGQTSGNANEARGVRESIHDRDVSYDSPVTPVSYDGRSPGLAADIYSGKRPIR